MATEEDVIKNDDDTKAPAKALLRQNPLSL